METTKPTVNGRGSKALVRPEHAKTWHSDDRTAPDGSPRGKNPVRRVLTAEYKLAILAEYDRCTEKGEKGLCCRRRGCARAWSVTVAASIDPEAAAPRLTL